MPHPQREDLPEAADSELTMVEGRLVRSGETNAFTGWMTETYTNSTLKSRSAISNGLMHGVSEGWYTNGQIQVREHFVEGVSHGGPHEVV